MNESWEHANLKQVKNLKFRMKSRIDGDTTFVELGGAIDETADFGDIKTNQKLTINLENVTFMNSVGTRSWCLWIQRFREPTEVTLVRCPAIVVKSFSIVRGILTDHCTVQSFYVPYYSQATGERKDFLAIRGTHFLGPQVSIPPVHDSKGAVMELDVADSYFAFLKPNR